LHGHGIVTCEAFPRVKSYLAVGRVQQGQPFESGAGTVNGLSEYHARLPLRQTNINRVSHVKLHSYRGIAPLLAVRGGDQLVVVSLQNTLRKTVNSPEQLFRVVLGSLCASAAYLTWKDVASSPTTTSEFSNAVDDESFETLRRKYLAVFWCFRLADWLQGPYFTQVYASKVTDRGSTIVTLLFLTGFMSGGLLGPGLGWLVDNIIGNKAGALLLSVLGALGALSVTSSSLVTLFIGRIISGIASVLLFSVPEGWLMKQCEDLKVSDSFGRILSSAFVGDSLLAIVSGLLATKAVDIAGSSIGPFMLSACLLVLGGVIVASTWNQDLLKSQGVNKNGLFRKTVLKQAIDKLQIVKDPSILAVGACQTLFESAMYVFVLTWPAIMENTLGAVKWSPSAPKGAINIIPYGTIFASFMASCYCGSTLFSAEMKRNAASDPLASNRQVTSLLRKSVLMAGFSLLMASCIVFRPLLLTKPIVSSFADAIMLTLSLILFEVCVGIYFPSIGCLRKSYFPAEHRAFITNLFRLPQNIIIILAMTVGARMSPAISLLVGSACLFGGAISLCSL
jgi:MFS family permease